jgi:hypothetical protein
MRADEPPERRGLPAFQVVTSRQRYSTACPCPVCGVFASEPRGEGLCYHSYRCRNGRFALLLARGMWCGTAMATLRDCSANT